MAPTASTFSLGPQLTVRGGVSSKGPVHVSGEVIGDIDCSFLLLSPQSILKGNVVADDVIVQGQVAGIVRACRVILQAGCKVEGDLFYNTIVIEEGAELGCVLWRCANPHSFAPAAFHNLVSEVRRKQRKIA